MIGQAEAQQESWTGVWEGFLESRRAIFVQVELSETGTDGLSGRVVLPGTELPAEDLQVDGSTISFWIESGPVRIQIEGERIGDILTGTADDGSGQASFRLRRLPSARPGSRVEAWRQDLQHTRIRFFEYDRSYAPEARAEALRELSVLESELPQLSDGQIVVRLSRIAALADNAHTRLYLLRNRTALRRYPIRLAWFSDGLFVVRAAPELRAALGCRVTSIAGSKPRELRDLVGRLFSANGSWLDYKSTYFMTSPEILRGLGVVENPERIKMQLICNSIPGEIVLEPLPLRRKDSPTEAWRDLSPNFVDEHVSWIHAIDPGRTPPPLYLTRPTQHYWYEYLREPRILYLQYNRSQDMPNGEPFETFAERFLAALDSLEFEAVVVDLRFNTGGSTGVARAFVMQLTQHRKVRAGKLYALSGAATFSAGIYHLGQLKQYGDAIVVGRHPGDRLDYWSEGGNVVLPNSRLTLHFTNGYHSYSKNDPGDRPLWSDLSLDSLEPDVPVRLSSTDYFGGVDPLLEVVVSRVRAEQ